MNRLISNVISAAFFAFAPGAILAPLPVLAYADDNPDMSKMIEERAPAYVTVKYILKTDGGDMGGMGGDQEMEITGVMIDPKGLVLVSSTEMTGFMGRLMGEGAPPANPTEIKVLVGDDSQGTEAKVIARDSELDLTWVQIGKSPEKPYAFIDLAKGATPKIGETVFAISRMGKFFDRAPLFHEFKISGIAKKPRDIMFGGGGLYGGSLGLPIFNVKGEVAGISTLITPDAEEMQGMAGGMMGGMRDMMAGAILPVADVVKATLRARETAAKGDSAPKEDKPGAEATGAEKPK